MNYYLIRNYRLFKKQSMYPMLKFCKNFKKQKLNQKNDLGNVKRYSFSVTFDKYSKFYNKFIHN